MSGTCGTYPHGATPQCSMGTIFIPGGPWGPSFLTRSELQQKGKGPGGRIRLSIRQPSGGLGTAEQMTHNNAFSSQCPPVVAMRRQALSVHRSGKNHHELTKTSKALCSPCVCTENYHWDLWGPDTIYSTWQRGQYGLMKAAKGILLSSHHCPWPSSASSSRDCIMLG